MVKLSEVTDEHFEEVQSGPIPSDNDDDFEDYSDSDSEGENHHHGHSHGPHGHSHGGRRYKDQQQQFTSQHSLSESEDEDEDEDDDITIEESIYERFVALKDIIPIKQRTKVANAVNGVWEWIAWSGKTGGKAAFVISTGVMMVGVPYALAVAEEGQMVEMEREMKLQQSANELIAGGVGGAGQQQQGAGGLQF
ncbi:mitochondrial import receptor subunit Tom22-domain-containing protein [Peziza echinospora]|nr:mitochondrial import receptor subunit Tom22-domain-containing protein [Peziza echinospora]